MVFNGILVIEKSLYAINLLVRFFEGSRKKDCRYRQNVYMTGVYIDGVRVSLLTVCRQETGIFKKIVGEIGHVREVLVYGKVTLYGGQAAVPTEVVRKNGIVILSKLGDNKRNISRNEERRYVSCEIWRY